MPDLLDCLMPACHQVGVITTPAVASVTFPAVIAAVALAVTIHRLVCPMSDPGSLLSCPRAGCRRALTAGADGVEMLVRYRLCEHHGHAEEKSAK
jgi:hypothetical protein